METKIIECFGGVLKEEPLSCIENNILLKDTCVLESVAPFYGYYDIIHVETKPMYLYLMLAGIHTIEEIYRSVANIREKAGFSFDAAYGQITVSGYPSCETIRIKGLPEYNQIALLQQYFKEDGIRFKKKSHKIENIPGLIRLEKFFCLEALEGGIFFDKKNPYIGYFVIPKDIAWKNFVELTTEVKYDTGLLFFDVAKAFFFEQNNIIDMVRIYREQLSHEKLKAIRDRFLKLFEKYS